MCFIDHFTLLLTKYLPGHGGSSGVWWKLVEAGATLLLTRTPEGRQGGGERETKGKGRVGMQQIYTLTPIFIIFASINNNSVTVFINPDE